MTTGICLELIVLIIEGLVTATCACTSTTLVHLRSNRANSSLELTELLLNVLRLGSLTVFFDPSLSILDVLLDSLLV